MIYAFSAALNDGQHFLLQVYEKCFIKKAQTSQPGDEIDTATSMDGMGWVWGCGASRWKTHKCAQCQQQRREKGAFAAWKGQTSDIDNRETQGTQHLTESDGRCAETVFRGGEEGRSGEEDGL